jgi:hypothetical protein
MDSLLTTRDASSSLAVAFKKKHKLSPVHEQGRPNLLPVVRSLLKAYDNVDPPNKLTKSNHPKAATVHAHVHRGPHLVDVV